MGEKHEKATLLSNQHSNTLEPTAHLFDLGQYMGFHARLRYVLPYISSIYHIIPSSLVSVFNALILIPIFWPHFLTPVHVPWYVYFLISIPCITKKIILEVLVPIGHLVFAISLERSVYIYTWFTMVVYVWLWPGHDVILSNIWEPDVFFSHYNWPHHISSLSS